jgi:metallo-beta-lactamase class B
MNMGMPSSGPMIVESIRKLGLKREDIKLMINGHAHIDHAGAFAFFKQQVGAQLAVMRRMLRRWRVATGTTSSMPTTSSIRE